MGVSVGKNGLKQERRDVFDNVQKEADFLEEYLLGIHLLKCLLFAASFMTFASI